MRIYYTVLLLFIGVSLLGQTVANGSVTGAPVGNSAIANAGWTNCGFSPDLCDITFPSYVANSQVTPSPSPDGGSWLGLAALGECANTTITGLTIGNIYTLCFYGACFGTGTSIFNNSPAAPQICVGATCQNFSIPLAANTWTQYSMTFTASSNTMVLRASHPSGSQSYASLDGFIVSSVSCTTSTTEAVGDTICIGQQALIYAFGGSSYNWFEVGFPSTSLGTNDTLNISPSTTTQYYVVIDGSINDTVSIVVQTVFTANVDTTICQGGTLTINGITYNSNGFYQDTIRYAISGCDSIQYVINLTIDSFSVENIDTTICQGEVLTVNGITYSNAGVYNDTAFYTQSGCDSIQYLINLTIDSFSVENIDTTICQGEVLTVNGITYSNAGVYNDTAFYIQSGCDSIRYNITLNIDSFSVENIDTTICQGEVLTVNGITYVNTGVYSDTAFYSQSGCDSIRYNITLNIDSFSVENIDTTICQGEVLTVNGVTYSNSGVYNDAVFYSQSGCDSIQYVINLTINSFSIQNIDTTICQGEVLTVNGITYVNAGVYNDTAFYSLSGCDSVQYVINLMIDSFSIQNIDTTICQGEVLTVNGITYSNTGVYNDAVFYSQSGCDSVQYVINLTIDSFSIENIDTTICQGEVLIVNGTTYSNAGIYNDTAFYSQSGCDSVQYVINLTIDSFSVENIDITICQGESFTLNGVTYNTSGFFQDTARYAISGCDSIKYNLTLNIDSFILENIDTTICQGEILTINGVTYSNSGVYNDAVFYSQSGCDSIQYVINLTIDSFSVENIDTTICQGEVLTVNGITYVNAGVYNDTAFYLQSGCDSIRYNITLNIDSFSVENIDTTICQGEVLTVNGITYSNAGVYNDTAFYTQSGCDSIQYVINLTIDSFSVENVDTTICQGEVLTVNGISYSNSGIYNDTAFYSQSGCDSIRYNITLNIDSFSVENIDTTICQGEVLTVNGITYSNTGVYNDTAFYTQSGCDSIRYLINLTIDSFSVENIDTTICQGEVLTVNGITYVNAGVYSDTAFYSQSGCDSIRYNITLNIDSFSVENIDTTICQGEVLTVNGITYVNDGVYNDTAFYSQSGCDSVQYIINLTIDSFSIQNIDTAICQGDSIIVNGVVYSATGTYSDTNFYAISGCVQEIFNVNLIVNSLPTVLATSTEVDNATCINNQISLVGIGAQGNSYTWNNGITDGLSFNTNLGITTYIVSGEDVNGCISTDTIEITGHPIFESFVNVSICENENYTLPNGTIVNTGGSYPVTLNTINGCDSVITTNLTVNQLGVFTPLADVAVCNGFSQELNVNAQNMTSIEWFVNDGTGTQSLEGNPNYINETEDALVFNLDLSLHQNVYSVEMVDECGNTYSTSMTLEVYLPQNVSNPTADTTFCIHEIDILTVDYNGNNYVWNTGNIGPSILIEETGEYIVEFVENGTNCLLSDTIFVTIEDCISNCVVLAPTGFSPDANGINDIFRVVSTCDEGFSSFVFVVYNRWGEMVFSTNNWRTGWDGIYKGKLAEIGTYTFYVEYTKALTNQNEILRGNITLIR